MSYDHIDETYKGHRLRVTAEENPESPNSFGETSNFLVAAHRQFWVPAPGMEENRDPEAWLAAFKDTHWQTPIEAYIHSGVQIARSCMGKFTDRRWDVSNIVGFILLSKEEWPDIHSESAQGTVDGMIETWNQYLSGDVWGYTVEHEESGWEESCWGFYGADYCTGEAKSMIDWHVAELRKQHQIQVKKWIRNRVPLLARV